MRALGVFSPGRDDAYARGQQVIVRTDRGMEVGEVLTEATEHVLKSMTNPGYGQILRVMTATTFASRPGSPSRKFASTTSASG